MGQLIDGSWKTDAELTRTDRQRETTAFRSTIGTADHPVDDRYHLYVSPACPWAHGAMLVRSLLGLEDVISMDIVDPYRQTDGWEFTPEKDGCTPDTQTGATLLREVYIAAEPQYTGRVTVPVLWDTETETIVNNESIEIMRMLADRFAERAGIDLYPEELRAEIDATVKAVDEVIPAAFEAGMADAQAAYETGVRELFEALDRWEERLATDRFLVGEQLTLADLRLFVALVRFDAVFYTLFKCNSQRLVDYPNLWGFTRDVYQLPDVAETVDMDHIKVHNYRSYTEINPTSVVPVGPDRDFTAPHDRETFPGGANVFEGASPREMN